MRASVGTLRTPVMGSRTGWASLGLEEVRPFEVGGCGKRERGSRRIRMVCGVDGGCVGGEAGVGFHG